MLAGTRPSRIYPAVLAALRSSGMLRARPARYSSLGSGWGSSSGIISLNIPTGIHLPGSPPKAEGNDASGLGKFLRYVSGRVWVSYGSRGKIIPDNHYLFLVP